MTKAWLKHKSLLHDLYIAKRHKLKRVMEIMEKKHNFVACRRTYMKMFCRWGYQKNKKSQPIRRENTSSRGMNARPLSGVEPPILPYKINGNAGITHRAEVLIEGNTTTEATVEPIVSYQATGGASSPLDEFKDANDLDDYVETIKGALLLNEITKNAKLSGNPDPHSPAMLDYQRALGGVISDDTPV